MSRHMCGPGRCRQQVWAAGQIARARGVMPLFGEFAPELGCMEATHLTSMACKVSATDCADAGIGKRRGRQVIPLGANGCLVAKDLMSRKCWPACLTTN